MQLQFMEELLRIEADAKYVFGRKDRSYEQTLMDELLKIMEEVEQLFGQRDRTYELLPPRITECGSAYPYVYLSGKVRIYLTAVAKYRVLASYQLSHEAIHVLGPTRRWTTVLEEGLATWFSHAYTKRTYGLDLQAPNQWYDAAMRAVSPMMAKNRFVVRELRAREPHLSRIDEKLLVEVAGVELEQARLLSAPFESSWLAGSNWTESAVGGTKLFVNGARWIWESWKAGFIDGFNDSYRRPK